MSDTKWRKLSEATAEADLGISRMKMKFIDVETTHVMRFPPGFRCPHAYMDTDEFGPVELRAIEWLEVAADLRPVLDPIGRFPLEIDSEVTRVTGYRR